MALKCGTYNPNVLKPKHRSNSAAPSLLAFYEKCKKEYSNKSTIRYYDYNKWKYRKCISNGLFTTDKTIAPLGGINFVDLMIKRDKKRAAVIEANYENVKINQHNRMKSNYLCSEYCSRRKYEKGVLNDKHKDFKITQSKYEFLSLSREIN